ncbi:Coronin [Temnothorax longispinosus]|uniref:Coronin n=1 Tax=Temnothorax longispinosus TaxID=300112 RepID=A0A4S2KXL1_9HYME|nr:Coronin [Temnothorax longispinosus]
MSGLSNRIPMTTSGRRNDRPTRDSDRGDSRLSARDRPDYRDEQSVAPGDGRISKRLTVASSAASSCCSRLPKVVMRERIARWKTRKKKKKKKRRPERAKARRRKRPVEEWRTFRYRSPPHNRTSVTEGAIPDHLVSLHRGGQVI